ncbi:MAG TPA: vanadium-dependent haloperoxidase [Saprospiraceae bacterium]|nr:vanadium-dependent haloperoxidase [Saprospiraceae bacterium]
MKLLRQLALLSLVMIFSFFNPKVNEDKIKDYEVKSIALQWYNLFLHLESKDTTAFPPISAKRLADLGICGYLALDYQKTMSLTQNEALALLNQVYSESLHKHYVSLDNKAIESVESLKKQIASSISIPESSKELVIKASQNIQLQLMSFFDKPSDNFCEVEGTNENTKKYSQEPKYSFHSTQAILPNWGQKNTIVVNKNKVTCAKPYESSTSFQKALYEEALEIYSMSHNLTKDDVWVAEFWGDDVRGLTFSPPARWISILNQIIKKEELSSAMIMELYLKMGVGLYDAAVVCWKNKYDHNLLRPSDFIQKNIDGNWQPFHANPEFPAYPSGHSVFGAVSSRILEVSFGYHYTMTDMSHSHRIEFEGKERTYNSFQEMAQENAYSRMIMGVHYKQDCDEGLRLGYEIADIINSTDFRSILIKDNYHL